MTHRFDTVVVGQGLAGTTLAWHLRWTGFRVAVVDRDAPVTSSRIAAGLITPITGRRLAKSWRFDELFPSAVAFYRRVESETGVEFFTHRPMVRLFRDEAEQAIFAGRAAKEFHGLVNPGLLRLDDRMFSAPLGGFEMTAAGRLAVPDYLNASRTVFARDGGLIIGEVQSSSDVELVKGGVRLPKFGLEARGLIYCQGSEGAANPWFRGVRFNPAKGEILTLRVNGLVEDRVVNRGVWLAPTGGGFYRAGSTYDRDNLDAAPTDRGRDEICAGLRAFQRLPFEVVGHAAAIRPVADNRKVILGLHPEDNRIGYFNGLGSKGSLVAPYFAAQFAAFLASGSGIDPEVELGRVLGQT